MTYVSGDFFTQYLGDQRVSSLDSLHVRQHFCWSK